MIAKGQFENRERHVLVGLALLFLFVNLYCYTDILPLTGAEDLRCLIAQEMLLSGDYLHPTVFSIPYYKKPPMHNWLIALANARDGAVDRVSARAVSIAALLIMGLSMYLFLLKKRPEGALIGFLAVTTNYLMMCEYGNLAETDMTLTLFTFLSFILYMANPTHLLYVFLSSLFMGAGILTKGLSPFFFYPAVLVVTLRTRENRGRKGSFLLLHFVLSLLLPALWLWLFSLRGNLNDLAGMLTSEVSARYRGRIGAFVWHLFYYPGKVFVVLLPWSLLLLFAFRRKSCKDDVCRASVLMFAISLIFLTLSPDGKDRYLMPAFPAFAIVCAYCIDATRIPGRKLQQAVFSILAFCGFVAAVLCWSQGYLLQAAIFVAAGMLGLYLRSRQLDLVPFATVLVTYLAVMYTHGLLFHRAHYRFDHEPGAAAIAERITEPLPLVAHRSVSKHTWLFLEAKLRKHLVRLGQGRSDSYYYLTCPAWVEKKAEILLEIPYPPDHSKDFILQRVEAAENDHGDR